MTVQINCEPTFTPPCADKPGDRQIQTQQKRAQGQRLLSLQLESESIIDVAVD